MLDFVSGQVRDIHEAGLSLKGRQKLRFFDPSAEWRMARLFDCRRCAWRGSVKGCCYGAMEIGEAVLRRYWLHGHVGLVPTARTKGNSSGEEK